MTRDPLTIPEEQRSSYPGSASSASSPPSFPSSYQHQLSSSSGGATPSALQVASEDGAKIEGPTSYSFFNKSQESLYERFLSLLKEVEHFIVSRDIDLKDITRFLTSPPHHLRQDFDALLSSPERIKLSCIKSAEELFRYLGKYWNQMEPTLLVHLVDRLKDEALISKLHAYQEDLKQYNDNTPIICGPEVRGRPDSQGGQSVMKVQLPEERSQACLSYVGYLAACLKRAMGYGCPFLYKGNEYSSIYVVYSIPCPLDKKVFDRKEVQKFLKEHHILRVYIDEECVFEVSPYNNNLYNNYSVFYIECVAHFTTL